MYACKEDKYCEASLCEKDYDYGSECLTDSFGLEAAKEYSDFFIE